MKTEYEKIAKDGIITPEENSAFIRVLDQYQKGLEQERIKADEKIRSVVLSCFWISFTITVTTLGAVVVMFGRLGIPIGEAALEIVSLVLGIIGALGVLKMKGWVKGVDISFARVSDILKSMFGLFNKEIPENDVADILENIPESDDTTTPITEVE